MNEDQLIPPVPEGVSRPLWSVMIPVYNRTKYVRKALESVLVQDPGSDSMQICIVDNSTEINDWSEVLSKEVLHRIEIYKQPQSVLVHENWNTCVRKSRGHLVHILHDDDWVADGFYNEVESLFFETPQSGCFSVRSFSVDEAEVIGGVTRNYSKGNCVSFTLTDFFPFNPVQCPGMVVQRTTYERVGGYRGDMQYVIDLEMWLRIVSVLGIRFSEKVLSFYRSSTGNGTEVLRKNAANLEDLKRFCIFATENYKSLRGIDWKSSLLLFARNQERYCLSIGDLDAARCAKGFWFRNASVRKRLFRNARDIAMSVVRCVRKRRY